MGCGASSGNRDVPRPVAPFRFDDGQMGNFRRTIPLTAVEKFNHGAPITKVGFVSFILTCCSLALSKVYNMTNRIKSHFNVRSIGQLA